MSAEPTAERYLDSNGQDVWRIVCDGVVLQDGIASDRVAESLAEYRNNAGDTGVLTDGHSRGTRRFVDALRWAIKDTFTGNWGNNLRYSWRGEDDQDR
jgi:hypothetical protein